MSIDLLSETRLSLTALAKELGVSCSTTWRWALNGVGGQRLETFNLGGRRFTTRSAVSRFLARTNGESPCANPHTHLRRSIVDRADKTLAELLR